MVRFIEEYRDELERLVRFHRDYASTDDLMAEIWLAAIDVRDRLGTQVREGSKPHDSAILHRLGQRLDRESRRWRRSVASLDQTIGCEPGGSFSLMDVIAADSRCDPEVHLSELEIFLQNREFRDRELAGTYSEASAYMILLDRVQGQICALAELLLVTVATLRRRLARAIEFHRIQSRLFDGISTIDPEFELRVTVRRSAVRTSGESKQQPLWIA